MKAVKIVAGGTVSGLGSGVEQSLAGLFRGQPALRSQALPLFDPVIEIPYCAVADAPDDAALRLESVLDGALRQLLDEHPLSEAERCNTPIFIGSSGYGIGIGEQRFHERHQSGCEEAMPLPLDGFMQVSRYLREQFQFHGPDFAYNTACTSSANALLAAATALHLGQCDYALVVGIEVQNSTTLGGFHSMQLLAENGMRPFDLKRNGLLLGEGCAALLLRRAEPNEGGTQLLGGASRCDTYSISTSNPDGSSIAQVMEDALQRCGVAANDVVAIKAHGTATPLNDDSEAAGMKRLFGDGAIPPFFSMKASLGHTLGGCGAIETLLMQSLLQQGELPASGGFDEYDPKLGVTPAQQPSAAETGIYLLNFFGFGGNNCSLVMRHQREGEQADV